MTAPWLKNRLQRALELRAQGKTFNEIGTEFGISGKAVRNALVGAGLIAEPLGDSKDPPKPFSVIALDRALAERARRPQHRRDHVGTGVFASRAARKAKAAGLVDVADNLTALAALWLKSKGRTFADFDMPYEIRAQDVMDNRDGGRLNWSTNPFALRRSSALGDASSGSTN